MSKLEVRGLSFAYEDALVFEDVGFSVERGQVFCLVGPNGCGKTTLVHCVLAHLKPRSGEVLVDGRDAFSYSQRDLAAYIAYVPQNHVRSFPYRAVDVVAMGQTRKQGFIDMGAPSLDAALKVMERLGIGRLAQTEYTTLSGGELQMVLIARALVQESDVLVLDEPTAHLDVRRAQDVLCLLADIAKDDGKAVLMSTHEFNQPLMLQDAGVDVRMALMERGRLSAAESPLELLSSGSLEELYGVRSRIVEVDTDPLRHFLAVWIDAHGR